MYRDCVVAASHWAAVGMGNGAAGVVAAGAASCQAGRLWV